MKNSLANMGEETCRHVVLWIAASIVGAYSCTLPTQWDGEWHDSSETTKDITFTLSDNYVEGWSHQIYSTAVTSWTCIADDSSSNLLLFKSNQTVDVFGALHNVYRCMKWEKLTDYSYTYSIYANIEDNAGSKRVLLLPTTDTVNIINGCDPSLGLPSAIETVVLIKKGYIQNATQNCPTPLLGRFNYTFNDSSTIYCDGNSVWDVCSDQTQMVVNYTLCSTTQFYSTSGVAYCAYSASVGSNYYVTVVNTDTTVDFTSTFRFTCYAVTTSGDKVYASDNKGACGQNQTPQDKMSTGAGTLTFTSYGKACPFISGSSASESSSNLGLIAGIVAAVLVIAVAVVVGIVLHKKCTARKGKTKGPSR
ncbi:uncharacterized protein LOC125681012 [Ostrea edulis]|uniref:uncharacterized protein LOC125681012 n=1 Tax=Ostrea edulis TaxID=37623 RepID=UPI0024AF3BC2|nr:uncharacterized protein LOC125681012 [Ostrea edulis]